MDVNYSSFKGELLPVLRNVANADFVSIDLEMSGIGIHFNRGSKPSTQEVYEGVKNAAETYQVLQVGITCVEKDVENDLYMARPYNFMLSPLFIEKDRLKLERTFSFSSATMHFLLGIEFDIEGPFKYGVPYLSRDEEHQAREIFKSLSVFADVIIKPDETEALQFVRISQTAIQAWVNEPQVNLLLAKQKLEYVNVAATGNYGAMLVHQLIRQKFPYLKGKFFKESNYVRVEVRNELRETQNAEGRARKLESMIADQTGLRYVFEALFGGDLSTINPAWFTQDIDGKPVKGELEAKKAELDAVVKALKVRRPAIVGHNIHNDLAFMYKTFIGNLPETFKEFSSKMHALCPMIIDTKWLATYNFGSMDTTSDLSRLSKSIQDQAYPYVTLPDEFSSYALTPEGKGKLHEAGYDSWITAELFLKLSAKMSAAELGPPVAPRSVSSSSSLAHLSGSGGSDDGNSAGSRSPKSVQACKIFDFKKAVTKRASDAKLNAAAAGPSSPLKKLRGAGESADLGMNHAVQMMNGGRHRAPTQPGQPDQWIPAWDSNFWSVYGNKLRVYHSDEGWYELKNWEEEEVVEG